MLWSKICFKRNSCWKIYEVRYERGILIDANSGPLRYVLWRCGSICHQPLTINFSLTKLFIHLLIYLQRKTFDFFYSNKKRLRYTVHWAWLLVRPSNILITRSSWQMASGHAEEFQPKFVAFHFDKRLKYFS